VVATAAVVHIRAGRIDWRLFALAASVPGALLGSRLTGRLSEQQLVRAIAVVLLVVAAVMAVDAVA
jgi:uncharacterized membrane protein YfcA